MNDHPSAITINTMVTLVTTMTLLTTADSRVPRISSADRIPRMTIAGMFMTPVTPSIDSNGECRHWYGISSPMYPSTRLKNSLQAVATGAAPTAYSRTRSQPMIQATNSPIVAYEYV